MGKVNEDDDECDLQVVVSKSTQIQLYLEVEHNIRLT